MQLLSIFALVALMQGAIARNLCKVNQRYCGSAFKHFDNAGSIQLKDNELYVCADYDSQGRLGRIEKVKNAPIFVQSCPHSCHVEGGGKNDYCTVYFLSFELLKYVPTNFGPPGEKLFIDNTRLANCANDEYQRTARKAVKADTKLKQLKLEEDHYRRLFNCVFFLASVKTIGNTDEAYNKQVRDLERDLSDGIEKSRKAVKEEEAKQKAENGGSKGN